MKLQTLIYSENENLLKRMDDILYEPKDVIIIDNEQYEKWLIYDEFEDWLVRKIYLQVKDYS